MLISSLVGDSYPFEALQFALVIALYNLNEPDAAQAILSFKVYTTGQSDELINIKNTRLEEERANLYKQFLESAEPDVLSAFLHYLQNNKVLTQSASNGARVYSKTVSLDELLFHNTITKIYDKTLELMIQYAPQQLIVRYIETSHFYEMFSKFLRKSFYYSADKRRRNVITDGDVLRILVEFKNFVSLYSTSAYEPLSGNPDGFLRNIFNFAFKSGNQSCKVFSVLNRTGLDKSIGEEWTILDTFAVTEKEEDVDFDYYSVVRDIQVASKIMFTHKSQPVAFYDIFSVYRDKLFAKEFADLKKIKSCNFNVLQEYNFNVDGNISTLLTKMNHRLVFYDVLEPILTADISSELLLGMYEKLYSENLKAGDKNGVRIFSINEQRSSEDDTNSEIFKKLVNGFLALRKLLLYLRKTGPTTGLSIKSFPVAIFQNSKLLYKFSSLENYVENLQEVLDIEEQAKSEKVTEGFIRNEDMQAVINRVTKQLAENQQQSEGLRFLFRGATMSKITSLIEKEDTAINRILNLLYNIKKYAKDERGYFDSHCAILAPVQDNIDDNFTIMEVSVNSLDESLWSDNNWKSTFFPVTSSQINVFEFNKENVVYLLNYLTQLEYVISTFGGQLYRENESGLKQFIGLGQNYFTWLCECFGWETLPSIENMDKSAHLLLKTVARLSMLVPDDYSSDKLLFVCFYLKDLASAFLQQLQAAYANVIESKHGDSFLLALKLDKFKSLLTFQGKASSLSDLAFLGVKPLIYIDRDDTTIPDERITVQSYKISEQVSKLVVTHFNSLIKPFTRTLEQIQNLYEAIKLESIITDKSFSLNTDEAMMLRNVANSIELEAITHRNKFDTSVIQYLSARYDFTSDGYCLKDGSLLQVCLGSDKIDYYLHKFGVGVSIANLNGLLESKTYVLNRSDINGF